MFAPLELRAVGRSFRALGACGAQGGAAQLRAPGGFRTRRGLCQKSEGVIFRIGGFKGKPQGKSPVLEGRLKETGKVRGRSLRLNCVSFLPS